MSSMVFRTDILSAVLCVSLFGPANVALAQDSAAWVHGLHSRARLVSGDAGASPLLAGVEIALDPGFKTYWRNPGESGLPPRFDWSKSANVKDVEIRWPAPIRSEDAAGVAYVYHDKVLLPALVTPLDPAKPVRLNLTVDYGICKDICIPASATLERWLGKGSSAQADIETVMRHRVPRPQAIGQGGDLSILALKAGGSKERPTIVASVKAPAGTSPDLFVEAPEGWYFSTSRPDDHNRFVITLDEKPKDQTGDAAITLTLVAGESAIESEAVLDADGKPRY